MKERDVTQDMREIQNSLNKLKTLKFVGDGLRVKRIFGPRILVKLVEAHTEMDEAEKRGIVIPQSVKEKNTPMASGGFIVAVGEPVYPTDVDPRKLGLTEGQIVMFSPYAGSNYQIEKDNYKIIDVREVMAELETADGSPLMEVQEREPDRVPDILLPKV